LNKTINKMPNKQVSHQKDYEYVNQLLSGEADAWRTFYKELRQKLITYIKKKYPNTFSLVAIEEILDGVGRRLIENNFKTLREYRGECAFSTYLTRATEWELKDWLRKHSDELFNEPIDNVPDGDITYTDEDMAQGSAFFTEQEIIPEPVRTLSDDLRLPFLLRYYDYFGFPLDEIRLLAKKRAIPIGILTEKIVTYFDPAKEDVLQQKREKQILFQKRLQKLTYKIHKLNIKDHQLSRSRNNAREIINELNDIRGNRAELESKKKILLKGKSGYILTTSYEIIADILGEENISTIRSRVFQARNILMQKISMKNS
jgi:DNA-directed RNA polymerase specialized sigma24 family protein